ncbi:hypothetical protein AXX12_09085 [Anaerosporomusa subterranea]|uniref:Uncharacterized protein n=1 Tax=Anaerosporomusa subterranea TaxID=1794912 RepID=A0A154BRC2_ANASB|nr:hypothetical protein [Anaerosporomusa subterranea]KYZ76573.1 hypothetical protein AXX12_09085 [Anaerosporomusa subterranea]
MQFTFEWKAQHAIDVIPGSYFSTAMIADGTIIDESRGHDEFQLNGMVLPEKRLAGFGREQSYQLDDLPAGLSALEAAASHPVEMSSETAASLAFAVDTNLFLSQGLLSHYLSLGVQKNGNYREIPLQSPEVEIDWQSRGKYIVSVKSL